MIFNNSWSTACIVRIEEVTPTIRLIELSVGETIHPWTAGAHIRVRVLLGERTETRTYSLVDIGADDGLYRIAVKLLPGGLGGSRYMWSLAVGATLEVSQPHNDFGVSLNADSYTLIAGGVGITPLLGIARFLTRRTKPVRMVYTVRTRAEAAFAGLLASWLGERLQLCVSAEGGRVDLERIVAEVAPGGELYVCGPIGMLETARTAWRASGRPMGLLRHETFASSGHYPNRAFTASLPRFGIELHVAENQTLLVALEQAGVEVLSDCLRGECGLCAVDIINCDGPIDHRDVFLSDEQKQENQRLCACVSRPAGGRVEIDTAYRGTVGVSTRIPTAQS